MTWPVRKICLILLPLLDMSWVNKILNALNLLHYHYYTFRHKPQSTTGRNVQSKSIQSITSVEYFNVLYSLEGKIWFFEDWKSVSLQAKALSDCQRIECHSLLCAGVLSNLCLLNGTKTETASPESRAPTDWIFLTEDQQWSCVLVLGLFSPLATQMATGGRLLHNLSLISY